jgi:hypothetical protein
VTCRPAFTDSAWLPQCFNVLLSELSLEMWTISSKGHSLSERKRELHLEAVYGGGFAATCLHAMEPITILNRCYRFRGFVYQRARFSADKQTLGVAVRPHWGSAVVCSPCHLEAPGYDQLAERPFEFIPVRGFLAFHLYTLRRVDCASIGANLRVRIFRFQRTLDEFSAPDGGVKPPLQPTAGDSGQVTVPKG